MSVSHRLLSWPPGTSCGPRTRERFLPAGDPETGATAEEPTKAANWLRAKKPRGNRRKLSPLPEDLVFIEMLIF